MLLIQTPPQEFCTLPVVHLPWNSNGSLTTQQTNSTSWGFVNDALYHFLLQNETLLCKRFTAYVLKYDLMAKENLIVPMDDTSAPAPPPEDPRNDRPMDSEG